MTRAEDRLYVSGWHGAKETPDGCWYQLIQDGLARLNEVEEIELGFTGAEGWSGQARALSCPQITPIVTSLSPPERYESESLPDHFLRPAPPEPKLPRPLAPSQPSGIEPPVRGPLDEDGALPVITQNIDGLHQRAGSRQVFTTIRARLSVHTSIHTSITPLFTP